MVPVWIYPELYCVMKYFLFSGGRAKMNMLKRISKVFKSAAEIPFDDSSRIILMMEVVFILAV